MPYLCFVLSSVFSDSLLIACRVPGCHILDRLCHLTLPPEGNMASFMIEDLSDEFTSPAMKLSASELWPGWGDGGNQSCQSGRGTSSPPTVFCWTLTEADFC